MKPVSAACDWCGRSIAQNAEGRWYAIKGEERGYDPLTCEASDDGCHDAPDNAACALPLELADDFGGRVQVMHGSVCVGLVVHDKPGLVLTSDQARTLAAMLVRQANHADATFAGDGGSCLI